MTRDNDWEELLVFIHGVTPGAEPGPHGDTYNKLKKRLNEKLGDYKFEDSNIIEVEWGWQSAASKNNFKNQDGDLAAAERIISRWIGDATRAVNDNILFIFRRGNGWIKRKFIELREYFLYAGGDLFYYVGQDGETAVRENVFAEISERIARLENVDEPDKKFSLTIIAHSAGGVIAHDFLWRLFGGNEALKKTDKIEDDLDTRVLIRINRIREMIENSKFRIRRFYTIGTPISPLALRSNSLIDKLQEDRKSRPGEIGLKQGDGLGNPRWLNFWDMDDFFAYPVEFLYDKYPDSEDDDQPVVKDEYVDVGNSFIPFKNFKPFFWWKGSDVHNNYWDSRKVAKKIAENWLMDSD